MSVMKLGFTTTTRVNLLIIDIDNLDFVDHQEDLEKIISMVDEKLKK